MSLDKVFYYICPVGKKQEDLSPAKISGSEILVNHTLYPYFSKMFSDSEKEADLDIKFISDKKKQDNAVRTMILETIKLQSLEASFPLISKLSKLTDNIIRTGLVFVLLGKNGTKKKIVIMRFPAEEGIVVDNQGTDLKLISDVFLKNSHRYKAAIYSGESTKSDFWKGKVVDRQINDAKGKVREVSDYWIVEFLESELEMTAARGSELLGRTLRAVLSTELDEADKQEIIEASISSKSLDGKKTSIRKILNKLKVGEKIKDQIISSLPNQMVADQVFTFEITSFNKVFAMRLKFLNTGAILIAPNDRFDTLFSEEVVEGLEAKKFSTTGKISSETIRTKI